jgi:hypothetical protein
VHLVRRDNENVPRGYFILAILEQMKPMSVSHNHKLCEVMKVHLERMLWKEAIFEAEP